MMTTAGPTSVGIAVRQSISFDNAANRYWPAFEVVCLGGPESIETQVHRRQRTAETGEIVSTGLATTGAIKSYQDGEEWWWSTRTPITTTRSSQSRRVVVREGIARTPTTLNLTGERRT
ncbi:hypothetical protein LSAT2_014819 [Lamellibrachia satsuma]|nr:hypothetical protein LSAT2_014819 [Lamellibrachia satsuma]